MAGEQQQSERSQPAKRIRWATKRVKGPKADAKRISIFNRRLSKRGADEKKRESGGSGITGAKTEDEGQQETDRAHEEQASRRMAMSSMRVSLHVIRSNEGVRPL